MVIVSRVFMRRLVPSGIAALPPVVLGALLSACPRADWTPPSLREPGAASAGTTPAAINTQPVAVAPPATDFSRGVTVTVTAVEPASKGRVAFGVPLAPGAVKKLEELEVVAGGKKIDGVRMSALVYDYGPKGERRGVRSVLIELPPSVTIPASVEVRFGSRAGALPAPAQPGLGATFRKVAVSVKTSTYGAESRGTSTFAAVPRESGSSKLFDAVEPAVVAAFPPGYLAHTRLFGDLMSREDVLRRPDLAGMRFLSDAFGNFADGAMGATGYAVHPSSVAFETEAWLYDRCATYLLAYAHGGAARHLLHGIHSCASYARQIGLAGERRGIFAGKKEPDTKYSHARGLYAYYALTGDEVALEAGRAIADMWATDPLFVEPYRAGSVRGVDKLWTERLLAAGLEGGVYGFLLTGEARFLESARGIVKTAIRHITTNDAAELRAITKTPFPPQSCFIHNAEQQAEGNTNEPWCSSWMSELVVDPMLRYQELTGEAAVDEIFVRLARSMRDVGTMYFKDNPLNDAFLTPSRPFVADDEPRLLAPLYGYGIDEKGKRRPSGEWSDFEHCPDAMALTAVALRALKRQGKDGARPTPASSAFAVDLSRFRTESESFVALHQELAFCASQALDRAKRERRDPRAAPAEVLANAASSSDPRAQRAALDSAKIGWPVYDSVPRRKLSWWFNTSIGTFSWLDDAKVPMREVRGGVIQ